MATTETLNRRESPCRDQQRQEPGHEEQCRSELNGREAARHQVPPKVAPAGTIDVAEAAEALARFTQTVLEGERAIARAVLMAAPLLSSGVCESVEGMTLDLWLANTCRLIGADRHTLLTASEVLEHMPVVAGLFADGQLSWGQVRNICRKASRLDRDHKAILDRRLEQTLARWGGLDVFDPDELLWAADDAITELNEVDQRRKERDGAKRCFFAIQPSLLDDGGDFFGHADAPGLALISNALGRACTHPDPTSEPDVTDDGDDEGGWLERSYRRRANYQGLMTILGEWMGGSSGRPARPAFLVHIQADKARKQAAGILDSAVPGFLPGVSATWCEILARDADVRAVLFDGKRPLATSRSRKASEIPGKVRWAVRARDLADRFPGSNLPASASDYHHIVEQRRGGDHDPDNVILLGASRHNRLIHRRGWRQHLDPQTGMFTISREGRTFRSLPPRTPLEPDDRRRDRSDNRRRDGPGRDGGRAAPDRQRDGPDP